MKEIAFQVEDQHAGGFTARSIGVPIVARTENVEGLAASVRKAVIDHYAEAADRPETLHLYFLNGGAIASVCSLPMGNAHL